MVEGHQMKRRDHELNHLILMYKIVKRHNHLYTLPFTATPNAHNHPYAYSHSHTHIHTFTHTDIHVYLPFLNLSNCFNSLQAANLILRYKSFIRIEL